MYIENKDSFNEAINKLLIIIISVTKALDEDKLTAVQSKLHTLVLGPITDISPNFFDPNIEALIAPIRETERREIPKGLPQRFIEVAIHAINNLDNQSIVRGTESDDRELIKEFVDKILNYPETLDDEALKYLL